MKAKLIIHSSLMAILAISLTFTSCSKKDDTDITTVDDTNEQGTNASDESRFQAESEQGADDANAVIQGIPTVSGKTDGLSAINLCNASIDTTQKSIGLIKITYSGNNCAGTKSRSGSISIQFPYDVSNGVTKWKTAGCKISLTFEHFKVTRLSDNKSLTIDGSKSISNLNGGLLKHITPGATIIHSMRGNMNVTFDNGTQRQWQIARKRSFSLTGTTLIATLYGDTTIGTNTAIATWGTNRVGDNFFITIPTPIVIAAYGSSCLYEPKSGVRVFKGIKREMTVTYGVNADGTKSMADCPYGYKLNWTNVKGVMKQVIKPY